MEWREKDGVRWLEADLPGARAAFSTRLGGESTGPFESLNLGLKTQDQPDRVKANRLRLAAVLGRDPAGVLMGHQVHGNRLIRSEAAPDPSAYADAVDAPEEADAQATSSPDLTALVQVADCLPIAIAGSRGVAMVHGGWRGLAAGIVPRAADEVSATAAAIGPGIGPCCYEVGQEVLDSLGVGAGRFEGAADGNMLDLTAVARAQLEEAGITAVDAAGLCTSCHPDLLFSHRRDKGVTGRQAGLAWLEA
jgi:purine-nucleoside/S-methyl-5'-thioadenosine phosphorylase / adenosine deaminase